MQAKLRIFSLTEYMRTWKHRNIWTYLFLPTINTYFSRKYCSDVVMMMELTGEVLLSGKSTFVQNFGLFVCAKKRKLLKKNKHFPLIIGKERESSCGKYWIWFALELSRTSISLISKHIHWTQSLKLNLDFWENQLALTEHWALSFMMHFSCQQLD